MLDLHPVIDRLGAVPNYRLQIREPKKKKGTVSLKIYILIIIVVKRKLTDFHLNFKCNFKSNSGTCYMMTSGKLAVQYVTL